MAFGLVYSKLWQRHDPHGFLTLCRRCITIIEVAFSIRAVSLLIPISEDDITVNSSNVVALFNSTLLIFT